MAVRRCISCSSTEVATRGYARRWMTIGVAGHGPWLLSTSRSPVLCLCCGCPHRRATFRLPGPARPVRARYRLPRSLRLQATASAARSRRTTPRPPPPGTRTPIPLAAPSRDHRPDPFAPAVPRLTPCPLRDQAVDHHEPDRLLRQLVECGDRLDADHGVTNIAEALRRNASQVGVLFTRLGILKQ